MRNAFSQFLISAAKRDKRMLLLTGDHGSSLFANYLQECPDQFINCGIAEQNMVSVAAGLAKGGFRPIVYALSAFLPNRVLEQIKLDICYEGLPVILVGDGAGVVYSTLGSCHHNTEDISALRALPEMRILSPGDAFEVTAALNLAFATGAPAYIRMGKGDLGPIHSSPLTLQWGELVPVQAGTGDLALIATGAFLSSAVKLAKHFEGAAVWSAPCLKPLEAAALLKAVQPNRAVATLEEHNILGGLGSIMAEILSEHRPMPVCRIGIPDRFSQYTGSYNYLMKEHRLDFDSQLGRLNGFLQQHGFETSSKNVA
jgi:transketolase